MQFIGHSNNNSNPIPFIQHFYLRSYDMTKTWFITGTSTGLGRLLTERLLARGDRVVATLRRPDVLKTLAAQYGEQLHALALDVTDTQATKAVVAEAFQRVGHIDVVVSNAGYA